MKNKTKYQLRIDTNKLVILDDNYVHTINKLIRDKEDDVSDFMVEIIDQYNLIDDELNTITNYLSQGQIPDIVSNVENSDDINIILNSNNNNN